MRPTGRRARRRATLMTLAASCVLAAQVAAQTPVDEAGNPIGADVEPLAGGVTIENPTLEAATLSAAELETLVGPIALYPDDLLAIVLPASTYPLEVVQAVRFLEAVDANSSLEPDESWDDSVVALLNYPDVLRMMNDDIDWTWRLGEAVVAQQPELITAIESFRDRAYAAGNLKSDEHQTVTVDDGVIEIDPVGDDVIYVPYYEPAQVVTVSPRPVYHYYPDPCPVYYYPYSRRNYYRSRPFWGVTTAFTIGWATDRLHVYHNSYAGHPYYGYSYYGSFWRRPSIGIYNSYYVDRYNYLPRHRYVGDYWRPRHRSGARPRQRVVRNYYDGPRNDRRAGRPETRTYRESGGRRFSDTIRNATRAGVSTDRRLNRRAVNNRNATTVNRSNRGRDADTRQNRVRRAPAVDRDAIRFRARGNGGFTATRSERARQASGRRDTEVVRQARSPNRAVQNTRATHRADRRASTNRPTANAQQRRGFVANRAARSRAESRPNVSRPNNRVRQERRAAPRQTTPRRAAVSQRRPAAQTRSSNRAQRKAQPQRAAKRSESRRTSSRRRQ